MIKSAIAEDRQILALEFAKYDIESDYTKCGIVES
jgi:hypothetical protein